HLPATRLREPGPELPVRQRRHQRDHARRGPDDEQQAGSVHFAEDLRGNDENARPDHRPDDQRRGVESGDRLDEVDLRLLGGGHWRGNLVAPAWGRYVGWRRAPPLTRETLPCACCPGKKSSSTCSS